MKDEEILTESQLSDRSIEDSNFTSGKFKSPFKCEILGQSVLDQFWSNEFCRCIHIRRFPARQKCSLLKKVNREKFN
jgi:hypothetical protein